MTKNLASDFRLTENGKTVQHSQLAQLMILTVILTQILASNPNMTWILASDLNMTYILVDIDRNTTWPNHFSVV